MNLLFPYGDCGACKFISISLDLLELALLGKCRTDLDLSGPCVDLETNSSTKNEQNRTSAGLADATKGFEKHPSHGGRVTVVVPKKA